MREIEFCMKYADSCNRCPRNRICEREYQREYGDEKDLQVLRSGRRKPYMPTQKKPGEKGRQAERQIQKDKSVDREKQRDPSKG